jgi:hypothetical protein
MSSIDSAISASSGDFETITIVTPNGSGNRATIERAIVQDLAVESSGSISSYDSTTAGKINTSNLPEATRKQFEITTQTAIDGRYSLLSEYQTGDVSSASSFSLNVAGNSKTTSIVQSSTSWADSCLKIDITGNYGPFDDLSNAAGNTGAKFTATFDSNGSNVDDIKAVNSQYSTTDNSRPLQIVEADFNSSALGVDQDNWYSEDATGNPVPTALSTYSLSNNSFLTTMTNEYASFDFDPVNNNRFGTFKIVREPQQPLITINTDYSAGNSSSKLPFQSLPSNTLTESQFFSIFDSADVIATGYKFDINANDSGLNSGFGFGSVSEKTDEDTDITLDDSGLKNNETYMESWVTKPHSLEIAKPTFNITAVDGGNTVNVSGFSLSSGYETLSSANNNNGQIMINKFSTADDARISYGTTSTMTNAAVNVYYEGEGGSTYIDNEDKINSYVEYSSRKVLQQPLSSQYVGTSAGSFMTSGNYAALNLYGSSSIVNSSFNTNKFDFNFTSGDTEVAVFKVSGTKPLTDINGLLKTSGNSLVSGVSVSSVLKNFNGAMSANTFFANAKINFTSKPVTALSFHSNAVADAWILSGTDCKTNSVTAFNQDDCKVWPKYDDVIDALTNDRVINVTMSVITGTSGGAYALQDKVNIEYSVNGRTESVNVNQSDLTFENQTKFSDSTTVISSGYTVSGPLVGRNVQLEQHTVVRKYRYGLKLNIRPYDNLTAKTPYVKSETIMYKVLDLATNKYYSSMYLKYVTMGSSSLTSTETISAWDNTYPTTKTFTIQPNDFKSLNAIIVGTNTAGASQDLTGSTPIDPYYGIDTVMELLPGFETTSATGDVSVVMNCDYLDSSDNLQSVVTFLASDSWYVTLIPDYAVEYMVENFNSSYANLATNTNIDNDTNILSVDDAFANITKWNDDEYKVVVTYNSGVTTLSVQNKNGISVEKFNIKLKDDSSLVATAIVSYSEFDAYRRVKQIGSSGTPASTFISVNQNASEYKLSAGVYVKTVTGLLSSVANGAEIAFTLKGDNCGVNMVGSVASLSELSSLTFQYGTTGIGEEYSRILTLPFYRGYQGVQSADQVYTINRGKLDVDFTIADSNGNSVQTINSVYAGLSDVAINNLSPSVGDIGLKLSFVYSLLDDEVYTDDALSIPIVNAGDAVTFTIVNPNGSSQTVPAATTLKTRTLYTFSAANFNSTGSPLVIRSYRLKVNSSEFDTLTTGEWTLELKDAIVKVYYSNIYLGNPTGLTYGTVPIANESVSNVINGNGITINGWNIKIDPTISSGSATCYWAMLPPYLKFSQTVYAGSVVLPYTPGASGAPAIQVSYEPVSVSNIYNPFSSSTQINNITYTDLRNNAVSDYINNANTNPYEICVEGNTYTISYCLGLQSGSNFPVSVLANPLFSGAANRLLNVASGSSVIFWTDTSLSNNSAVKMNFLQPTISEIYSAAQLTGETDLLPNILVQFGTFFYSAGTQYLNLPTGDGVKTYLYTRVVTPSESEDNDTVATYTITIYKYIPVNLSDWNNQPPSKQIILAYGNREYYEHIVSIPLGTGTTVKDYLTEIRGSMPINSIIWTTDTAYNNSVATEYITVKFLSQNAKREIPALLWTVSTANNNSKGVIVNQAPLFNILNKIGYSSMAIYNNGTVNTSTLSLTPA